MKALAAWRGKFGDAYTERNAGSGRHGALIELWREIIRRLDPPPESILEIGAGGGANLQAIKEITRAELFAIEPNAQARAELQDTVFVEGGVRDGVASCLRFSDSSVDLVFTSGCLIHIPPEELAAACTEIHRVARRYIVCIEYFSAEPEEIEYHGRKEMLWKRDFGAFWMDNHPNLNLVGYGFLWKRVTGMDNLHWWAFSK